MLILYLGFVNQSWNFYFLFFILYVDSEFCMVILYLYLYVWMMWSRVDEMVGIVVGSFEAGSLFFEVGSLFFII